NLYFDDAIWELQSLHDVNNCAYLVNFDGLRLIDAGIMLRGEKDFLVGGQRFFKGAHAGFPSYHERRHHVREDDHVADGHHGQLLSFEFFLGRGHEHSKKPLFAISLWLLSKSIAISV